MRNALWFFWGVISELITERTSILTCHVVCLYYISNLIHAGLSPIRFAHILAGENIYLPRFFSKLLPAKSTVARGIYFPGRREREKKERIASPTFPALAMRPGRITAAAAVFPRPSHRSFCERRNLLGAARLILARMKEPRGPDRLHTMRRRGHSRDANVAAAAAAS